MSQNEAPTEEQWARLWDHLKFPGMAPAQLYVSQPTEQQLRMLDEYGFRLVSNEDGLCLYELEEDDGKAKA